jgi:hypothetical protein
MANTVFAVVTALVTALTPVGTTSNDKMSQDEIKLLCTTMANLAGRSCSSGFNADHKSKPADAPTLAFAKIVCERAAKTTYDGCMDGSIESYGDKTGNGICADLAAYFAANIVGACKVPPDSKAYGSCVKVWAPVGTNNFRIWCEKKEKEFNATHDHTTDI